MATKFQYNRTALQNLDKQLKMRLKALPVIKNKETALRIEVKRAKASIKEIEGELNQKINIHSALPNLWAEFNKELISVAEVKTSIKKIAGVKTPQLEEVVFNREKFSLFNSPKWFAEGIAIVHELGELVLKKEFFVRKMELLEHARRKTTQKVNLYEKVQIPEYNNAIRKIKRFLEDEENLSKSSQKIVKKQQQKQEEES